jgi:hypothetical protein
MSVAEDAESNAAQRSEPLIWSPRRSTKCWYRACFGHLLPSLPDRLEDSLTEKRSLKGKRWRYEAMDAQGPYGRRDANGLAGRKTDDQGSITVRHALYVTEIDGASVKRSPNDDAVWTDFNRRMGQKDVREKRESGSQEKRKHSSSEVVCGCVAVSEPAEPGTGEEEEIRQD